ncbi:MAG TPA: protein-tyrosine phosphatase family protein [Kiritimatiellia bacterium]|nr:protein-tyrosine phosphatase family protein [Kiritimatiellia bacterium]HMO99902.1 protein-tyrosine phosphatase family protein [Kiritimatiellia bacterium]HMP96043.1 protein-tyrosine phosphatase family protein [Kiritimatiellia bacterium]
MFLEHIGRHLCVCGQKEVQPLLERDKKFWSVISIRYPAENKAVFRHHKRILHAFFDDADSTNVAEQKGLQAPTSAIIQDMLDFANAEPSAPLLVHCRAGISRSSAFALALMLRGYPEQEILSRLDDALEQLLMIRPVANPNALVLELALSSHLPPGTMHAVLQKVHGHPAIRNNMSVNPLRI